MFQCFTFSLFKTVYPNLKTTLKEQVLQICRYVFQTIYLIYSLFFVGLGSGFTIKVDNSFTWNYIPLYSNTKEERENRSREQRLQGSRFFQHLVVNVPDENGENATKDEIEVFPITNDMKDLLRTLDGYVFIIDASLAEKEGTEHNCLRSCCKKYLRN